MITHNKASGEV